MRAVLSILGIFVLAGCASAPPVPDDLPHAEELRSLRVGPLAAGGETLRIALHEWHKRPALITLSCEGENCDLEMRMTDGYGTYRQGRLNLIETESIEKALFDTVIEEVSARGFWRLEPQLREKFEGVNADGSVALCLHAPHYYAEGRSDGRRQLIYRYCQPNYADGLVTLAPLLKLAAETFPDAFEAGTNIEDPDALMARTAPLPDQPE